MAIIFNHQSPTRVSQATALKAFIPEIFKSEHTAFKSVNYVFCDNIYILEINNQFLGHDYFTDIISFDLSDPSSPEVEGEIYISVETVKENAVRFKTGYQSELRRVIFHGILHFCGFKDKTEAEQKLMTKMEDQYLKLFARTYLQ